MEQESKEPKGFQDQLVAMLGGEDSLLAEARDINVAARW